MNNRSAERIWENRDLGFEMLQHSFLTSKRDHNACRHGAVTLTRAALTGAGFQAEVMGPFPTVRSYRYIADLFRREKLTGANQILVPSSGSISPAAEMVLEGNPTPEFEPDFEPQIVRLGSAAVHSRATKETVEDIVGFTNWMRSELARQLLTVVDHQLINGDGTAPNVLGLLEWPIPTAASLKAAVSAVLSAGHQPDGIAMSPNDYADAADADPANWNGTLYKLPVVASTAIADGSPVVGAFDSATIFEAYGPTFEISEFHDDDFIQNLSTARAHTRFLLAVPAVAAFCRVTT